MLLVRGQDAERVLLTRPRLPLDDVGALIHIDCTLRQGGGLERDERYIEISANQFDIAEFGLWS